MPKAIKGNAGREAAGAIVESFRHRRLVWAPGAVSAAHRQAVGRVNQSNNPGRLHYAIKCKRAYYGLPGLGWIIEIAPYGVSVNVVFLGGAEFDPPPLGTTDRTRSTKVTTMAETQRADLHEWIEQAGRTPGWSKRHQTRPTDYSRSAVLLNLSAEVLPLRYFFRITAAGPLFFVSAWILMIFAGIVDTDVGIRPFGYLTSMIVTIALWLVLAPAIGAVAHGPEKGK